MILASGMSKGDAIALVISSLVFVAVMIGSVVISLFEESRRRRRARRVSGEAPERCESVFGDRGVGGRCIRPKGHPGICARSYNAFPSLSDEELDRLYWPEGRPS